MARAATASTICRPGSRWPAQQFPVQTSALLGRDSLPAPRSPSSPRSTSRTASSSPAWRAAADLLRGHLPLRRDEQRQGRQAVRHPGPRILENPWPNGTTGELAARMILDADTGGQLLRRPRGRPALPARPGEDVDRPLGRPTEDEFVDVMGYVYRPGRASRGRRSRTCPTRCATGRRSLDPDAPVPRACRGSRRSCARSARTTRRPTTRPSSSRTRRPRTWS
jgi:hypothetical protein